MSKKRKPIPIAIKIMIMLAMIVTSSQMMIRAALADISLFHNVEVTKTNDGNSSINPHIISTSSYNTIITLTSGDLADVDLLKNTEKYAVVRIPNDIKQYIDFTPNSKVNVVTNITVLYKESGLLGSVLNSTISLLNSLL